MDSGDDKKDKKKCFLCKHCGETNEENFYKGRFSSCKKCRNKSRTEAATISKLENTEPKTMKDAINTVLVTDHSFFGGVTLYQKINEISEKIEKIQNDILDLKNQNSIMIDHQVDLSKEVNNIIFALKNLD